MNSIGAFVLLFIIMQVGVGKGLEYHVEHSTLTAFDFVTRLYSCWVKSVLLDYKVNH